MEPDDLLCSRNAPEFVCLVGWSFWSVWFFWMNFRSDQPDKPDRRDRPDEPALVGRAQVGDPLARLPLKSPGLLIRLVGLPIRQQDRLNGPDKPNRQSNPVSRFTVPDRYPPY